MARPDDAVRDRLRSAVGMDINERDREINVTGRSRDIQLSGYPADRGEGTSELRPVVAQDILTLLERASVRRPRALAVSRPGEQRWASDRRYRVGCREGDHVGRSFGQ